MYLLKIYYENLHQDFRNILYGFKNKNFPFGLNKAGPKERYLNLFEEAKKTKYNNIDNFESKIGYKIDNNWIDDLALHTQVVIKKSKICYVHGRILYSVLSKFINNKKYSNYNILETGTSRGFSSLCIAKALEENNANGKIITVDYLPHDKKFYWNCIDDSEGKKSRRELISKWKNLCDKYIFFIEGYSKNILKKIKFQRIHFAFLDASHTYTAIYNEFLYISNFQKKDDIIIFDDYDNKSYTGLKIAIDEICEKYNYTKEVITSSPNRSYVIATKNK